MNGPRVHDPDRTRAHVNLMAHLEHLREIGCRVPCMDHPAAEWTSEDHEDQKYVAKLCAGCADCPAAGTTSPTIPNLAPLFGPDGPSLTGHPAAAGPRRGRKPDAQTKPTPPPMWRVPPGSADDFDNMRRVPTCPRSEGKRPMREVPEARFLSRTDNTVTVLCPYAPPGKPHNHVHKVLPRDYGRQHFAPPCGMYLSPEDRATGYTFEIRRRERRSFRNRGQGTSPASTPHDAA